MAGPGVLCGRICHIISKFLAGSMLELVGNPQEYVYIMSLSHLEQILECISCSTHAYRFSYHQFCMGRTQCVAECFAQAETNARQEQLGMRYKPVEVTRITVCSKTTRFI